jgi:general secretion pathway protein H
MPTWGPGNSAAARAVRRFSASVPGLARWRGFTLVELLVVVAIVALASAAVSLAVRDPEARTLEREAARLAVLLEAARAEARAAGLAVAWVPAAPQAGAAAPADGAEDFRFVGLPARLNLPGRWLEPGTQAQVIGAREVVLGPEPLIGAQRIALARGGQRRVVATDGLEPFAVEAGGTGPAGSAP